MRWGTAALTLTVCLGVVSLACADDAPSGNWFTNLFARPAAKDADKSSPNKDDPPRTSPANLNRKLKADLERRQDVCMKMLEIAYELGDEELERKANQLSKRAVDVYVAGKNRIGEAERGDAVAKKGSSK
jgi:hypothetical protein